MSERAHSEQARSQRLRRFELLLRQRAIGPDRARGCLDAVLDLCDADDAFLVFTNGEAVAGYPYPTPRSWPGRSTASTSRTRTSIRS